jgi:hypothetical protein
MITNFVDAEAIPSEKPCTKCKLVKPLTEFVRRAESHDGLAYQCKACNKLFVRNGPRPRETYEGECAPAYEMIQELKRTTGHNLPDLLAEAKNNDPYYIGSHRDWEKARWFAAVWEQQGCGKGTHIRRIHYRLVVQGNAKKYDSSRNTKIQNATLST